MFEAVGVSKKILKIVLVEPLKLEDLDKVFAVVTAILEKGTPIAIIADVRKAGRVPMETAVRLKAWMRKYTDLFRKNLICTAVLMSNTATSMLIRQLLKGVFLVQKPISPNGMFVSEPRCLNWINTSIQKWENNQAIGEDPDEAD